MTKTSWCKHFLNVPDFYERNKVLGMQVLGVGNVSAQGQWNLVPTVWCFLWKFFHSLCEKFSDSGIIDSENQTVKDS